MICLQCGSKMNEYPKGWGCPKCDNFHIKNRMTTVKCNSYICSCKKNENGICTADEIDLKWTGDRHDSFECIILTKQQGD